MFYFDVKIVFANGGKPTTAKVTIELDLRRMYGRFVRVKGAYKDCRVQLIIFCFALINRVKQNERQIFIAQTQPYVI